MTVRLQRNSKAAWRRVEGEVLIVSSERNSLTVLNDTAARVWELLDTNRTEEELAKALCDEFEVDFPSARRDVTVFVDDLLTRGLLRRIES